MDDRTRSALEAAFPDREVTEARPTGPSWNERHRTIEIEFADGERIYLKIATDGNGSRIARERAVIAYAGANLGIPVPTISASDVGGAPPYLATVPVSGSNLIDCWAEASVAERATLARRSGTRWQASTPVGSRRTDTLPAATRTDSNSIRGRGRTFSSGRSPRRGRSLRPIASQGTSSG